MRPCVLVRQHRYRMSDNPTNPTNQQGFDEGGVFLGAMLGPQKLSFQIYFIIKSVIFKNWPAAGNLRLL